MRVRHPVLPRARLGAGPRGRPERRGRRGARREGGGDHPARADEPAPAASRDVARASATLGDDEDDKTDKTDKNATAALRSLFASMVAGDRAVADPRRFADALSLETAAQQDGQEFLKLLLAYLTRSRREGGAGDGRKRRVRRVRERREARKLRRRALPRAVRVRHDVRSVRTRVRGVLARVDFYELELNVSACAQTVPTRRVSR